MPRRPPAEEVHIRRSTPLVLALAGTGVLVCQCAGVDRGPLGTSDEDAGTQGDISSDAADSRDTSSVTKGDAGVDRKGTADVPRDTPPDRAAPDVVFPEVKCADNLTFCEDFEFGALDPARWKTWTNGGTVTIDTTHVFAGKRALHIKEASRGEPASCLKDEATCVLRGAFVQTLKKLTVPGRNINIRFYLWMDKLTPNRWFPIAWMTDSGFHYYGNGFGINLIPGSETEPKPSAFETSPANIAGEAPTERWACWELEYVGGNELRFYLDEQLVPELTVKLPASEAAFEAPVSLGIAQGHPDIFKHVDGFNLWFDELAVSTNNQRIGCAH